MSGSSLTTIYLFLLQILIAQNSFAWQQINIETGGEDWFRSSVAASPDYYRHSSYSDLSQCYRTPKAQPIHLKGLAIWNRHSYDQSPDIRSVGFYNNSNCNRLTQGNGKYEIRSVPYAIVTLDPEKLAGVSIVDLTDTGIEVFASSWKAIDIERERQTGGILVDVPDTMLSDSVLVWRGEGDSEVPAGQQGWEPLTGGVTHIDPGLWSYLTGSMLNLYLREMAERVLNPGWVEIPGALEKSISRLMNPYISLRNNEVVKLMLGEALRNGLQRLLELPYVSMEWARPYSVHPFIDVKSLSGIEFLGRTGPGQLNAIERRRGGSLTPRRTPQEVQLDLSLASIISEPLANLKTNKPSQSAVENSLAASGNRHWWMGGIIAQWEYMTSVLLEARRQYNQLEFGSPNRGPQGQLQIANQAEPQSNIIDIEYPEAPPERRAQLPIQQNRFQDQFGGRIIPEGSILRESRIPPEKEVQALGRKKPSSNRGTQTEPVEGDIETQTENPTRRMQLEIDTQTDPVQMMRGIQTEEQLQPQSNMETQTEAPIQPETGIQTEDPIWPEMGIQTEGPIRLEFGMQTERPVQPDVQIQTEVFINPEAGVQTERPALAEMEIQTEEQPEVGMQTERPAQLEVKLQTEYQPEIGMQTERPALAEMEIQTEQFIGPEAGIQTERPAQLEVELQTEEQPEIGMQTERRTQFEVELQTEEQPQIGIQTERPVQRQMEIQTENFREPEAGIQTERPVQTEIETQTEYFMEPETGVQTDRPVRTEMEIQTEDIITPGIGIQTEDRAPTGEHRHAAHQTDLEDFQANIESPAQSSSSYRSGEQSDAWPDVQIRLRLNQPQNVRIGPENILNPDVSSPGHQSLQEQSEADARDQSETSAVNQLVNEEIYLSEVDAADQEGQSAANQLEPSEIYRSEARSASRLETGEIYESGVSSQFESPEDQLEASSLYEPSQEPSRGSSRYSPPRDELGGPQQLGQLLREPFQREGQEDQPNEQVQSEVQIQSDIDEENLEYQAQVETSPPLILLGTGIPELEAPNFDINGIQNADFRSINDLSALRNFDPQFLDQEELRRLLGPNRPRSEPFSIRYAASPPKYNFNPLAEAVPTVDPSDYLLRKLREAGLEPGAMSSIDFPGESFTGDDFRGPQDDLENENETGDSIRRRHRMNLPDLGLGTSQVEGNSRIDLQDQS
ncbi:hypothetical protein AOL_s00006g465 [Orbilia oligospora ATCC 24927]|uniref:Uncharacterized protein n=1 Tax=Arthrobotrys oligospora (strain ATCC 24927 / CBS 115.81 / DSM 1491) TaxID=756982 RepID=G1X0R4_ARTOA|nr:hypothetical protein AOL_s00006g465 [Orbilia oligospora ATCC 24927]EGX53599.1 hypothetical protein AOL_s00006g465 [Orbilia oligospora ATCC 24927]